MTIIIGSLCDDRKTALLLSDRMIVAGDGTPGQEVKKFFQLTNNSMVLTAGDKTDCGFIEKASSRCRAEEITIEKQADILLEELISYRLKIISQRTLPRFGFADLSDYQSKQTKLADLQLMHIQQEMDRTILNVELILGGVDKSGSHIYFISQHGIYNQDSPAFCCAPLSNQSFARTIFVISEYSAKYSLKNALGIAFLAKQISEKMIYVGHNTDVWLINSSGIFPVEKKALEFLGAKNGEILASVNISLKGLEISKEDDIYNKSDISPISQT